MLVPETDLSHWILIGIRHFERRSQADAALLWRGCDSPDNPPSQPVGAELKNLFFCHLHPLVKC
jgi:hypothetical protein